MTIDWQQTFAAVWRPRQEVLRPVKQLDAIRLKDLLGIDRQKQALVENTERFLNAQPANNTLLWGARGTGKSSLIKALLNDYATQGLRVVQIDKDDLLYLPEIVDEIREVDFRFVIFCDDLSFEQGENQYKGLKTVLEGSIEVPPENILLYATSNRRHLLPEYMAENLDARVVGDEVHYADATEEKISLSDRFGLWLSFHPITLVEYLKIVDYFFSDYQGDRAELHTRAEEFARSRASHSGRTAQQFFRAFTHQN